MPMLKRILISVSVSLMTLATVSADVLKLPDREPIVLQLPDEPERGMTKELVRTRYGEPRTINPPVGDPAISSWNYGYYTVYFEDEYVLHSVVHSDKVEVVVE